MRLITILGAALLIQLGMAQGISLMPKPNHVQQKTEVFELKGPLCVQYSAVKNYRLEHGVSRLLERLARVSGIALNGTSPCEGTIIIDVKKEISLNAVMDESFEIEVFEDSIKIKANTDVGALRAFVSVFQLHTVKGINHRIEGVKINDKPRFPWRGLLIDVCRHFIPKEAVLRQLEGLELVKMNVLHLHLTEDQGFRIESKLLPELHEKGSNGKYLTQEEIKEIIKEADLRGIRIIPEFDMPGHTTSWFVSHPEISSAKGPYSIETRFGVFDPTMDVTKEETYKLLDTFLGEMAQLFPDAYMHIGGDENNGKHWAASNSVQAFMQKNNLADNHALQAYFNKRLNVILTKHGKKMIGWDEILSDDLPKDILIQSWRGKEGLVNAATSGRNTILSNGYYIDLCRPIAHHYLNDPITEDMSLTAAQQQFVLGGEATMWAELVDQRNIDTRIWPRTAAIAERLWSEASVNSVSDMRARLYRVSLQLEVVGVRHKTAQEELLRLITRSTDVEALRTRVNIIQPVQDYQRHTLAAHTTHTPLTNLADAAVPDPDYVYYVDRLIQNHFTKRTRITSEELLSEFRTLRTALKKGEGLPEIPFAIEVLDFASEAVYVINGDSKWNDAEIERLNVVLQEARKPFAECELALLNALDALFEAALENSK